MQLDLKKIPFSKRLSRHMIYEESDNNGAGWIKGLYLALAADGGSSFIGGPSMGPKGFIRVTPTYDGGDLEYSYSASPFEVDLKTDRGGARFAIDGTKTLYIEGKGIGLRLNGTLSFGGTAITTERGIEFSMGGGIYLIKAVKGKMTLDCRWDLKALRSTDPIIYIEPDEDGCFKLALFDTDDAYELPDLAGSIEKCASAAEADYNSFISGLEYVGNGLIKDAVPAYALWISFISFKGIEAACANKFDDKNIYAADQSMAALPFKDASKALDIIGGMLSFRSPQGLVPIWITEKQGLYEAVPPLYAYAVSRLTENKGIEEVSPQKLSDFYMSMSDTVGWWLKKRSDDKGLCYYAYRHECGWPLEYKFTCDTPAVMPDLASYIILAADSLSKIAASLGRSEEAGYWSEVYEKQLELLINTLWNKTGFKCINAVTGASGPAEGILSLIPLILGKRLPGEIISALAEKAADLPFESAPVIPLSLIILGLADCGRESEARAAAEKLISSCEAGGFSDRRGSAINAGAFFSSSAVSAVLSLDGRLL